MFRIRREKNSAVTRNDLKKKAPDMALAVSDFFMYHPLM